jgi:hypothetical protein
MLHPKRNYQNEDIDYEWFEKPFQVKGYMLIG